MEIRSGKDSLKEKLLYIVILFVCLGCIAKMIYDGRMELIRGQLDIGTIGAMLFFLFFITGMMKVTFFALTTANNIVYRLDARGITVINKSKKEKIIEWDKFKTKRIVHKGQGQLDKRTEETWKETNACAVFCPRRIKDSFMQSPFPVEAWSERISFLCAMFSGLPFIIMMWRCLFQRHDVIRIYLEDKREMCGENVFYGHVDKNYFVMKMVEWHIELEDNKPEEQIPM